MQTCDKENCSVCFETYNKEQLIYCFNIQMNENENENYLHNLIHCDSKICAKCFLINYIIKKDTYQINCPMCKQILNYDALIRSLKNCKENIKEFIKTNYPDVSVSGILPSAYDEFVRVFKNRILEYELRNINNIECTKELFDNFIKTKKNDISIFASRDDFINCNLTLNEIEDIMRKIEKNKHYYNNWQEVYNVYNNSCLNLINEIETNLNKLYDNVEKNEEAKKNIIDNVIINKKTFVRIAAEIIYNAELINGKGFVEQKVELLYPCPKSECLGFVVKENNRCNNCNHLVCPYCRTLFYEHENYDPEKDELYNKMNKIEPEQNKKYIRVLDEHEVQEFNNIRINLKMEPFKPNKNNQYIISCNRDDYENCHLILKDSKPCPTCKNYIQRNGGCDQMFCINCHQCFDWITLKKLDRRFVHNGLLANYLASIGKKMDFSDIKCDVLEDDNFIGLTSQTLQLNNLLKDNIIKYYRKHNEIKDYVQNNNTRNLNDKILEIMRNFKIDKMIKFIFDMDYSRDKVQISEWEQNKLSKIKEQLYDIYDETYGKNIILEYYQTLGQGMNDTFLTMQGYIFELNQLMVNNGDNDKKEIALNNIEKLMSSLINWFNEMKNMIDETINILNPKYSLINLNDFR